ncbi:unnamed protein product [Cercopithifilaria johnstoni]|uniref:Uncharacterized protein n=1 Tax=Cercopithifilaria johnstoni TaxID=2874296 RepID=A0A8J2M0Z1_9BILA|nr:unnamed protein product [Cercopithifilaria johnstoni]
MLPTYFILISTLIGYISSAEIDAGPQFSPLTPYQTADSLPPPVYGLLEGRSDIDGTLINPKSIYNWKNYHSSKQRNDEISELSYKKRLSPASSKKKQKKNWKIPPGAKLVGYNMQLVAGYVPTTYFNNRNQKNDERRLESRSSPTSSDIYSKYRPGYNMNMTKNYDTDEKSNEMDTVTIEVDVLKTDGDDELLKDESILHTNFTRRESSFLEKQEESTSTDATTNITIGLVNLNGFLWPIAETKLKAEKQKEESISASQSDSDATTFVGPIEHDLSVLQKNMYNTATVKLDSDDTMDRIDDDPIPVFQSTAETDDAGSTSLESDNLSEPQLTILQNINSMKKYNDEMMRNSTSIPKMPQSRKGIEKAEQEIPFFRQLQMNYTDSQAESETEISRTRLLPVTTLKSGDTIIQISESNERERAMGDIKLSDIHVTTPSSSQNSMSVTMSNAVTVARTIMMNVESSEFDNEDENSDKVEQNDDNTDFENPEEFSKIQLAGEEGHGMSEKLNSEQVSRNVTGNDEHEELSQDENSKNDNNERWPQDKSTEVKNNSEEANSKNKEGDFRDDYDTSDNGDDNNNNDHGNDNDDVSSDNNDDDDDDGNNNNNDDSSRMIKDSEDEMTQSQENDEEKQGRISAPIFSPEQIPTFEEWLFSLPIQHAFPFNARNQPLANPIHSSFSRSVNQKNRKGKNKQERQRLHSGKKQKAPIYDYDSSEDDDKEQFQEQRFTLSRNVPYE